LWGGGTREYWIMRTMLSRRRMIWLLSPPEKQLADERGGRLSSANHSILSGWVGPRVIICRTFPSSEWWRYESTSVNPYRCRMLPAHTLSLS
jgi:hypothetical protein